MATTPSILGQLSQQVPIASQQLAQQQKAARDLQLQQMVGVARPAQATPAVAAQAGTALATQAGQQQVAAVGAQSQAQQAIAGLGQQVQQLESTRQLGDQRAGLVEQQFDGAQALAQISEKAKQELYDSRRQFQETELGRQFTNERQLADWARLRAGTDEQWQNYTQTTKQLQDRSSMLLQAAHEKLAQQAQLASDTAIQARKQSTSVAISEEQRQQQLAEYQAKLDEAQRIRADQVALAQAMQRKQAAATAALAKNSSIGVLVGTGLGVGAAVLAAPLTGGASLAGLAAAGAAGGAVGGGIGTLGTSKNWFGGN